MLSTKPIKNAGQARHYFYEKDNYYFKDSADAKELSQWYGKGADSLGLSGFVEPEHFESLLQGQLPNGLQMGKRVDGEIKHRPGYDLTFNAPKSVSLLAFIGGDKRLLEAHKIAVQRTLDYVEQTCAQARIKKDGEMQFENTGNLIFATFLQDLSRAFDPHLHTHCVTMNATQRHDGLWRALASNLYDSGTTVEGFWERVRHYQRYLGLIYRSELAFEVKQLGFTIETKNKGLWEIAGVNQHDLDFFSKRRKDIEKFMQTHHLEGARAASRAALTTRQNKKSVERQELHQQWKNEAKTDFTQLIEASQKIARTNIEKNNVPKREQTISATKDTAQTKLQNNHEQNSEHDSIQQKNFGKEHTNSSIPNIPNDMQWAVHYAIEHLSEKKEIFSSIELLNVALAALTTSTPNVGAVQAAIDAAQKQAKLLPLGDVHGNLKFTTPLTLRYEQENLATLEKLLAVTTVPPISSKQKAKLDTYFLQHSELKSTQRDSLKQLFLSNSKAIAIEGSAHSQKEMLYKPLDVLSHLLKQKMIVLAATTNQAEHLKKTHQLSITDTVQGFILKTTADVERFYKLSGKGINLVVTDAHTLSTKEMHALTGLSDKTGLRLILMGDNKSKMSVGFGAAFTQMQSQGMPTLHLKDISDISQKKSFDVKETLADTVIAAFSKINAEENIVAIKEDEKRFLEMAAHYVDNRKAGIPTEVLMPTKAQCERMNQHIHHDLKESGLIKEEGVTMSLLIPRYFTQMQYRLAKNYQVGQWVRFNESYSTLKVVRGDYCQIKTINANDNLIVLENQRGEIKAWNPLHIAGKTGTVEVFDEKIKEINIGEKVKVVRNMCHAKGQRFHRHEFLTVCGFDNTQIHLRKNDNTLIKLERVRPELRHLDYGYANHLHAGGEAFKATLTHQSSRTRLTSQRQFYQLLTSAENITLYTDDKMRLAEQLKNTTGDKTPLIDTLLGNKLDNESAKVLNDTLPIHQLNERLEKALTNLIAKYSNAKNDCKSIAAEAIHYAKSSCAEREASFTHQQILELAIRHSLGDVRPSMLQDALTEACQKNELIQGKFAVQDNQWTTLEAVQRERFILNWAKAGEGKYQPIAPLDAVDEHLSQTQLRESQKAAVRLMMTNTDRVVGIQGAPGTGKTTLLKEASHLLKQHQIEVQFLAPTHSAVRELSREGLDAKTLQQFLADFRKQDTVVDKPPNNRLVILDESSFASNAQIVELTKTLDKLAARAVLVGDNKQNPAIEAGKPSTLLEWNGMKMAYLTDIQRQKNPVLLDAVKAAYNTQFAESFKLLGERIIDDVTFEKAVEAKANLSGKTLSKEDKAAAIETLRVQTVVDEYFKRPQGLVMALTNRDRQLVNDAVREGMKIRGELSGQEITPMILEQKYFTEVERSRVKNFKVGQLLRFSIGNSLLGIEKGDYLRLKTIDAKLNLALLETKEGQTIAWQPKKYQEGGHSGIEVYQEKERCLQIGDEIRWTRSDKTLGLFGGHSVKIINTTQERVVIQKEDGQIENVDLTKRQYQHWDYAYAVTVHFAQGKTRDKAIVLAPSYHTNLANQPNTIVMLSRAVHEALLVTDNKKDLLQNILTHAGEKKSALEVIGEIKPPLAQSESIAHSQIATPTQDSTKLSKQHEINPHRIERERKTPTLGWDANTLTERLANNAESIVEKLLGKANDKSGQKVRFGNKGSLAVTIKGDKSGWWKDFETDEGGRSLISLIQRETRMDFKNTLDYAASLLGLKEQDKTKRNELQHIPNTMQPTKTEPDSRQRFMMQLAKKIAEGTENAQGTLVQTYLQEQRGITVDIPASIHYHSGVYIKKYNDTFPAMVIKLENEQGKVQSVHLTLLDSKTHAKAEVSDAKLKFGTMPETFAIDLNSHKSTRPISLVAEGIETALSLKSALPHCDVKAALDKGGFNRLNTEKLHQQVVLCLDNDLKNWQEDKTIIQAAERLKAANKTVWIAMPESINGGKTDYNDVLKIAGKDEIVTSVKDALLYNANPNGRQQFLKDTPTFDLLLSDPKIDFKEKNNVESLKLALENFNKNDSLVMNPTEINNELVVKFQQENKVISEQLNLEKESLLKQFSMDDAENNAKGNDIVDKLTLESQLFEKFRAGDSMDLIKTNKIDLENQAINPEHTFKAAPAFERLWQETLTEIKGEENHANREDNHSDKARKGQELPRDQEREI